MLDGAVEVKRQPLSTAVGPQSTSWDGTDNASAGVTGHVYSAMMEMAMSGQSIRSAPHTVVILKNLPDVGPGYYHFTGTDPIDSDDWGIQDLIGVITAVGISWDQSPRIGIGDMSLQNGGYFSQHGSHQKGIDIDARYMRNDGQEGGINLQNQDIDHDPVGNFPGAEDMDRNGNGRFDSIYDQAATQAVVDLFIQHGAIAIFVDSSSGLTGPGVVPMSGHHHHFHVRIPDPY